jgi:hypothetical protein
LFDDLDAQLEAAERAERAAESADLRRMEVSRISLAERLGAAVGADVTLSIEGVDTVAGELRQVGHDWLLVDSAPGGETVVALAAVVSASGLPVGAAPPADEADRRLGLGLVLRRLARDRLPVTVVTRTGAGWTGTVDRVGVDHLDLAEHAADQPRRATDVRRVRTIAFAAVAIVRPA